MKNDEPGEQELPGETMPDLPEVETTTSLSSGIDQDKKIIRRQYPKYKLKADRPICPRCGTRCADGNSLSDHVFFCERKGRGGER